MTKAVIEQTEGYIETALKKYNITDAAIEKTKAEYMKLKVDDIDDKEGYQLVRTARMNIKAKRIDVEKTRKGLKEESLTFGRAVDGEAKRIISLLQPIESYLHEQEKDIDDERLRIKTEVETKDRERIQGRVKRLYDMGMVFNGFGYQYKEMKEISGEQIGDMTNEEYDKLLLDIIAIQREDEATQAEIDKKKKEEEARLAKVKAEQEAESKRLVAEKARIQKEQEAKEAVLKAESDRIEAEKQKIEDEKKRLEDEKKRQAEVEKAEKTAIDRAKKESDEKAKREAAEKAEKERIAKMEAELAEKMKPDNEKLTSYADKIEAVPAPELSYEQSHDVLKRAQGHIQRALLILRTE